MQKSERKQPNIVFYFSDQQRHDTAGCYGQPLPVTPNLDALAAQGAKFENAFTCQPVCGPARACLQTGRYAEALGCYRNAIALPPGETTIARCLKEAGYEVGYVGKWHLASTLGSSHEKLEPEADYETGPIPPERRGGYSDYWVATDVLEATSDGYGGFLYDADGQKRTFDKYRTDAVTDYALDFLDTRSGEKPFFLFLSHLEPHHQNNHDCFEGPEGSKEAWADFTVPEDLKCAPGDWGKNYEKEYPDYLGCCHAIDRNLGRVIHKLKEKGLYENTVIIFTSDHGSHFRTRCVEYKRSCHESSIHVPLVIHGGPFGTDIAYPELVSLIDLPPTILRLAGAKVPESMQGHALQELLEDPQHWQQEVFLQISESQVGRCIRTKDFKYSVRAYDLSPWQDARSDVYHEEYFYDLRRDPCEAENLVRDPEYAEIRAALRDRLKERMRQAGERTPRILPALGPTSVDWGFNGKICDFLNDPETRLLLLRHFPETQTLRKDEMGLTINEARRAHPLIFTQDKSKAFLQDLTGWVLKQ